MQSVLERSYAQPKIFDGRAVKKNGTPKPIRWTVDEYYQMYDLDFVYSDRSVVGETDFVSPLTKPKSKINVADILP